MRKMSFVRSKKTAKKMVAAGMVGVLSLIPLAGCSSSGDGTDADESDGTEEVQTIIVGTGTSYEPACYLDEDGNLAGYEYEVLSAIDELLPQYEFEFQTMEFASILVALDAGQIDIAAHQYEENDERREKYLFGEEAYTTFVTYPVVLATRDDIETLDDLQGKTVLIPTGDNPQYYIDAYNEEHPDNQINVVNLSSPTAEVEITGFNEGTWDAMFMTKRDLARINEEYDDLLKALEEPLQNSSTYWLYQKGNTELQEAVDEALRELKESGRLSEISIEVFGADYTESE